MAEEAVQFLEKDKLDRRQDPVSHRLNSSGSAGPCRGHIY